MKLYELFDDSKEIIDETAVNVLRPLQIQLNKAFFSTEKNIENDSTTEPCIYLDLPPHTLDQLQRSDERDTTPEELGMLFVKAFHEPNFNDMLKRASCSENPKSISNKVTFFDEDQELFIACTFDRSKTCVLDSRKEGSPTCINVRTRKKQPKNEVVSKTVIPMDKVRADYLNNTRPHEPVTYLNKNHLPKIKQVDQPVESAVNPNEPPIEERLLPGMSMPKMQKPFKRSKMAFKKSQIKPKN